MRQSLINDVRDRAIKGSANISCEDILKKSGLTYKRLGNQMYMFCPFCDRDKFLLDRKEAFEGTKRSFTSKDVPDHISINVAKNMFYCFTCSQLIRDGKGQQAKGGPAKLFSYIYDLPYIDSALSLALSTGVISEEEFRSASSSPDAIMKFKKGIEGLENLEQSSAEKEADVKAPAPVCHIVYGTMITLPEFALSKEHYEYLRNVRRLTDEEIRKVGFFTYSTTFSIDRLVEKIRINFPGFKYEHLLGVPGFFFEILDEEQRLGRWMFKKPMPNCIGIPLRNEEREVVALQMRKMGENNVKNKYFYVTSKFISSEKPNFLYGASPSSPVAVCYPKQLSIPTIYIGEGFFKMFEVAKEGAVALSVQGVNSFSSVGETISRTFTSEAIQKIPRAFQSQKARLVLVYDADMYSNIQVLEACLTALDKLSEKFPDRDISLLLWKPEYGKGFDDMKWYCLENGINYKAKLYNYNSKLFISTVADAMAESDNEYFALHPNEERKLEVRRTLEYRGILYNNLYTKRISKILP